MISKQNDNLDTSNRDLQITLAKGILGEFPLGSLIGDLVGEIIPKQRMDRLVDYARRLNEKIISLEQEIDSLKVDDDFIDLIEESFIHAARAKTEDRREYIVNIVKNGIEDDTVEFIESKYLLGLLSEINDIEILWLKSFTFRYKGEGAEFLELHNEVLKPIALYNSSTAEDIKKGTLQLSYKEHLDRLGLAKAKYNTRMSGYEELVSCEITLLGKMLLKNIGV